MELIMKLFLSFIKVGMFSVGGGYAAIPLIRNQIVQVHGLMSMEEFADLVTIAEMTPGPVSINSSTFVGTRLAGLNGALLCTLGCILPSFIICLTLAFVYYKYRNLNAVQIVLSALRPAVVALIGGAGLSILSLALFQAEKAEILHASFHPIEAALFLGSFIALRKYKANVIAVIFGSGLIGTILYFLFGLA